MTSDHGPPDDPTDVPLVRAIFDSVGDAIVESRLVGDTPVITRANEAFVTSFVDDGGTARERPLETFVESPREEVPIELRPHETEIEETVTRRTIDGWHPYSVRVVPVGDDEQNFAHQLTVYSDRPIRYEYDDKLEALHEATRELIQQQSRERVARAAVNAAMDVLDLSVTSVHLHDPASDLLEPIAMTERLRGIVGDPPPLPIDGSLAGRAFAEGELRVYDDPTEYPEVFNPDTSLQSELIVPLGDYGVLMSGSTTPSAFSDRLVWLATILASNTEAALERIEREETLADRERELTLKNERLEAFARAVSHDLRNPLNVAAGRVDLAAADQPSEHLEAARSALDRMNTLVQDLLELARHGRDADDVEVVSVDDVASAAWSNVRTRDAVLETDGEIGSVTANRSRLASLFENLFRNALDHARSDVSVTIGPTADGFYVADDGPGVADERKEDVFEIGYSSRHDGTGMGLAIVEGIARGHGWEVTLVDSADGGARFEFDVSDAGSFPSDHTSD